MLVEDMEARLGRLMAPRGERPPPTDGLLPLPSRFVEALHDRHAGPAMPLDEYAARLRWGYSVQQLFVEVRARLGSPGLGQDERSALGKLSRQVTELIEVTPHEAIQQLEEAERSVVMCYAHAGVVLQGYVTQRLSRLPFATILRQDAIAPPNVIVVATSAPDAAQRFAKLVKAMRREPRAVTIVPDGGLGETITADLDGTAVKVGRGAPFLVHATGAVPFRARTRWTGAAFAVDVTQGPDPRGMGRDAYEAAFVEFYVDGLRRIVRGPPEDIASMEGFLRAFPR